ncbi:UbiA prenyltransferase family-domain-containing protein [Dactylonectria estremocensis]|uniref:UbiA prenyltransferase family-domain-containing protein n=1 Tax=Dactylonectria estremocensis TaxID=1079267 RepID=A0A9P9FCN2_9HYPO|nr:UbiA prenyltransferase family-domain-containing protein [Dactylonectria estremocensis]
MPKSHRSDCTWQRPCERSTYPCDMNSCINWLAFHLQTLWLFTKSDLPTSTGINTTFALAGILAGPTMISDMEVDIDWSDVGNGLLVALYFTWHLTLCFNLGNQRQPQSIIEDGTNKPWRPLPAGRITADLTRTWHLLAVTSLLTLCYTTLGAWKDTSFYLFCTWLYNERAWGDKSWWQRSLMNACGITTNRVATLRVAIMAGLTLEGVRFTDKSVVWFFICAGIVFTTIHVQDLRDQEGDALIDRQTLPLILGDAPSRWLTAVAICVWSIICPRYWHLGMLGSMVIMLTGAVVAAHMLVYRTRRHDQASFRLVGAWWVSLYFLPVMKTHGL